jgi:hypothetical protein
MYDIALSVNACVRSKTRAEIAWLVSPNNGVHALALTPGGGRIGKNPLDAGVLPVRH